MHEFSLYGQVVEAEHPRLLQQLAGLTRMQPKPVEELHLVFKAQPPSGLSAIPGSSESSSKQDVQRIAKMLTANIYMVKVIGEVSRLERSSANGDVDMTNGNVSGHDSHVIRWHFEFKDIPDAGKQAVNVRLASRMPIEDGDIIKFMKQFGYDYVSRYVVEGDKFYDQDTTLSLHRLYRAPPAAAHEATNWAFMDQDDSLELLDRSGAYLLEATVDATDGSVAEIKDRATSQLLSMRDTLKPVVHLASVDRLALDTRAPIR